MYICSVKLFKNKHHEKSEDFMIAVFAAFIDKITVNDKNITVTLRVEYSALHNALDNGGDNANLSGVFRRLPPATFEAIVPRKKYINSRHNV